MANKPNKDEILNARLMVVAAAEKKLGRSLTTEERQRIEEFDSSLYLLNALKEMFSTSGPGEILSVLAIDPTVKLLNSLSSSNGTLAFNLGEISKSLKPKPREVFERFDCEGALRKFSDWFLNLLKNEPAPKTIQAFFFSIYESEGGCKIRVSGTNKFEADNLVDFSATDWLPADMYAPLEDLSAMWSPLNQAGAESWVVMQAVVIVILKEFFTRNAAEFRKISGLVHAQITSGFVDGDLYVIRTAITTPTPR